MGLLKNLFGRKERPLEKRNERVETFGKRQADMYFSLNDQIKHLFTKGDFESGEKLLRNEFFQQVFPRFYEEEVKQYGSWDIISIECLDFYIGHCMATNKRDECIDFLEDLTKKFKIPSYEEELNRLKREIEIDKLEQFAEEYLTNSTHEEAIEIFNKIIEIDNSRKAEIYKRIGNYFFDKNADEKALEYFQEAVAVDPKIGVKRRLQQLSKKLQTESSADQIFRSLQEAENRAKEWWAKRDLANEYVKIKKYDHAWRLYNQAVSIRMKSGMSCDTIYPYMAKMREKEGAFKDALFLYLVAYRERLKTSKDDPSKYVTQGINPCLKKLGATGIDYFALLNLAKSKISVDKSVKK